MGILTTTEVKQSRGSTQNLDHFVRTYARNFLVVATHDYTEYNIVNDSALPIVGTSVHPQDTLALCIGKKCSQSDQNAVAYTWYVQCDYSSQVPIITNPDPTARPPLASASYQQKNEPVWIDLDGNKILNSAFDVFDQVIERQTSRMRLEIVQNYSAIDFAYSDWNDYTDTTNNAEWFGFPQYSCKLDGISISQLKEENLIQYYEVKFTVNIDLVNLWYPTQILDMGFIGIPIGETYAVTFLDRNGTPKAKSTLLDGLAGELPDDSEPVYKNYALYLPTDWTAIPHP
jgi:hypothetical protein